MPARLLYSGKKGSSPASIATRRAMELDACMHFANCSLRCSVGPIFETIDNPAILASGRRGDLRNMVLNRSLPTRELLRISEGAHICTSCNRCTTVCPVVACYDHTSKELGFLPIRIMHALGFGLRDQILSSRMLWDCVTCYACQEACPQNVRVANILYELRNIAYADVREEKLSEAPKDCLEKNTENCA